jgi:hypothetical protein
MQVDAPGRVSPVLWGHPAGALALESSDARLLDKARRVFARWPPVGVERPRRWRIEAAHETADAPGTAWRIDTDEPIALRRTATADLALWIVECSAQEAFLDAHDTAVDLHGALLATGSGRAVLVVGAGGAGKSTLACGLWRRGWFLLADDIALVEPATRRALPSPRRVRLREGSRSLLDASLWNRLTSLPSYSAFGGLHAFHPADLDHRPIPDGVTLSALVFLGRRGAVGPPATPMPLPAAHALLALLPYSSRGSQRGLAEALPVMQPIAEHVPAFDLARGPLDDMTAALADLVRA